MARFAGRFVVVTETQHVVKKNSFTYRSYPSRRLALEALDARDKANAKAALFKRSYIVDQERDAHVVLP